MAISQWWHQLKEFMNCSPFSSIKTTTIKSEQMFLKRNILRPYQKASKRGPFRAKLSCPVFTSGPQNAFQGHINVEANFAKEPEACFILTVILRPAVATVGCMWPLWCSETLQTQLELSYGWVQRVGVGPDSTSLNTCRNRYLVGICRGSRKRTPWILRAHCTQNCVNEQVALNVRISFKWNSFFSSVCFLDTIFRKLSQ